VSTLYFDFPHDELATFMMKEFKPQYYTRDGVRYLAVSMDEYALNTFSEQGSMHELIIAGQVIEAEMLHEGQFDGGSPIRYAGPIVVYAGADQKFKLRPAYEFHALFTKDS